MAAGFRDRHSIGTQFKREQRAYRFDARLLGSAVVGIHQWGTISWEMRFIPSVRGRMARGVGMVIEEGFE